MNSRLRKSLVRQLWRKREILLKEVADTEAELRFLAEDRESELEERAQEARDLRSLEELDGRGKREVHEIDAALERLENGFSDRCQTCGEKIPAARLRALPTTRLCVDCARELERQQGAAARPREDGPVTLPPNERSLDDADLETALNDRLREDGRIDLEELQILCRGGVVYLDGGLPCESEHDILRNIVAELAGTRDVVDHLQVNGVLWENGSSRAPERVIRLSPAIETLREPREAETTQSEKE